MLSFEKVSLSFNGRAILEEISFTIEQGMHVVLSGPSGSGKSSVLALMLGFLQPDEGNICFREEPLSPENVRDLRSESAWLPQSGSVGEGVVQEVLSFPFTFRANTGVKPSNDDITTLFERLRLPEQLLKSDLSQLSGGERKRVALALCLLLDKPILLLDEPTSSLDETARDAVIETVAGLKDATVISTSHDPQWISAMNHQIPLS